MQQRTNDAYVLGLDLGVASIGWAVLDADAAGRPTGIRAVGSHLFEAGVGGGKADPERAMAQGKEESKAAPRRDARAMRRQTMRRARRKKKVLNALIRHGLLPEGDVRTPAAIDAYLKALDADLRAIWCPKDAGHLEHQNMPYRLRAEAARRPLDAHAVGRALYHLAQRRGFLSNRKTPQREDEDLSDMKRDIGELADNIASHETPTLGAYLASLDPDEKRLRGRWTSRQMYLDEFEAIWSTQAESLGLDDGAKRDIHDAIFWQRPLKDQSHLVGRCSLEPGKKRAPIAMRVAQDFRVLQQVNHLVVVNDDHSERPLSKDERKKLLTALRREGDLTMAKARKAAGLPARNVKFSIEAGGEKKLVGHRTDAKLRKIFGDRWDEMSEQQRDTVVEDVRCVRLPDTLRRIGEIRWGLSREKAQGLADVQLEEGHSAHCLRALRKLVARMDGDGLPYSTARKDEYPASFNSVESMDRLPPVNTWAKDLRNPAVSRALTELRKLLNAIIDRHGKPVRIHLELARDLKQSRKKRKTASDRMRQREKEREAAARKITADLKIQHPKRWQIEKVLLAEECDWTCPFTGKGFGMADLLGSTPQVDVEHIWPYSRSMDDSFLNKTLCYHEENRNRKRGHTPLEAYGPTPEQYEAILDRVRRFKGDHFAVRAKLQRFTEPIEEGFTLRHLQDTRYITSQACDYLALLYGGRAEGPGSTGRTKRIITPSGPLTAWLRRGWHLNSVLGFTDEKKREDHRHHAIDAIVVALADDKAIKRLHDAAERVEREGKEKAFGTVDPPWDGFEHDVRGVIEKVIVSHRQSQRVRGPLHKDTIYSPQINGMHRVRKELHKLTAKDVQAGKIVDKRALAAIEAKLAELGEADPAKAFKSDDNAPLVKGPNGSMVRLRRVRVELGDKPTRFGGAKGKGSARYAKNELNHHVAFYDRPLPGGGVERQAEVVPLHEAMRRHAAGDPVVDRTPRGKNGEYAFAFSITRNTYLWHRDQASDEPILCIVDGIAEGDIELKMYEDGRGRPQRGKDRIRLRSKGIREGLFEKAHVTYLGEVRRAGG